ncbi:dde superfamily endonuclease [Holotrichia oblita]|uniref:Dde superfamily endonuclease n=1 Tax=Holotrichia oblita TaxID=644536 RepID=A0ACB9SH56_HOLOL|nr:dde superfamily endonuclease [Holotrichia oblita]
MSDDSSIISDRFFDTIDSWLMQHPGKPISIYEVAFCVGQAYLKSMLPGNIFKKCGIYPYDGHIFTEVDFLPSSVTDRPIAEELEYGARHSFSQTTPRTLAYEVTSPNIKQFVRPEDMRAYPKAEARKNVR